MWGQILRKQVTVHEQTLRYLDGCNYARQILGDVTAALYFGRLLKLANFEGQTGPGGVSISPITTICQSQTRLNSG